MRFVKEILFCDKSDVFFILLRSRVSEDVEGRGSYYRNGSYYFSRYR